MQETLWFLDCETWCKAHGKTMDELLKAGWDAKLITPDDLSWLPKRQPDGNKGTFGKVLVIAGSRGMSGAAYFSALGAYRTGAGLVKILTVPENRFFRHSFRKQS